MKWMLDTNTCIRYLDGRSPRLKHRLDQTQPSDLLVCSVVKGEMYYGAAKSRNPQAARVKIDAFLSRFVSLPFDDAAAGQYGQIRADLARTGMLIGPNDLLIAAIALVNQVTLVSNNTGEFSRVSGLLLEDWEFPVP